MQNPFETPLQRLALTIRQIKPELIDAVGTEALNFIDDNFRKQGFQDASFKPWPIQLKPNSPRPHRILILTATLRRSFTKIDGPDGTVIKSDLPYAQVHNDGFKGTQSYRRGNKTLTRNQNIPQRRMIGNSPVLTNRCETIIIRKITEALKH